MTPSVLTMFIYHYLYICLVWLNRGHFLPCLHSAREHAHIAAQYLLRKQASSFSSLITLANLSRNSKDDPTWHTVMTL